MMPPHCAACDLTLRDAPSGQFELVTFADAVSLPSGVVGHPRGVVWFCEEHAGLGQERASMTTEAALSEIHAIVGRRKLEALFAASRDSNADDEHDPEGATIGFERAQLTALLATARERLAEVDDALRRVDAATYGICERCGRPIAEQRLAARPFARCCIDCA